MQVQKHIFLMAQRGLRNTKISKLCYALLVILILCSIICAIIFLIATFYTFSNNDFTQCIKSASQAAKQKKIQLLQKDAIHLLYNQQIPYSIQKDSKKIIDNNKCKIIKNLNTTQLSSKPYKFSWQRSTLLLQTDLLQDLLINNYTYILNDRTILAHLINSDDLLTNELLGNQITTNEGNIFPAYKDSILSVISSTYQFQIRLSSTSWSDRFFTLIRSILSLLGISIITSSYIYGTIIIAPIFIIIAMIICSNLRLQNLKQIYKMIPWIGMHILIRQASPNLQISKSALQICTAMFKYFMLLYILYFTWADIISTNLISQITPVGCEQILFGYFAYIQFLSIIFLRTRPSLKWFPKIHYSLMFTILLYCQFTTIGYKYLFCLLVCFSSASIFFIFICFAEIPAMNNWNINKLYTPTINKPRIGLTSFFDINWINNMSDQWVSFMPLIDRQWFSQQQLALVDNNYELLNQNEIPVPPPAPPAQPPAI